VSVSLPQADVGAIMTELARAKPHAMTMNLVVWNADAENRPWVLERAIALGEKHPSRTIVLDAAPDAHGATVSAGGEAAEDQSARIEIAVGAMEPGDACEFARELIVPDIPTVLWWSSPALGAPFGCAVPLADATVVDSSSGDGDSATISELARFMVGHRGTVIRDLAWQRIHPWQDMVAHFFDDPHLLDELFTVQRLEIVSGSDAEALYLGGWLASRLSWTATARDAFVDRNGDPIRFVHTRAGRPRRVRSVALHTSTTTYAAERLESDDLVVRVWAEGAFASDERLFALNWVDGASLVERAILDATSDDLYETALRLVGTLVG
jgi:glucose-6-phosphate dehydrogenase assembly protein OpcA